MENKFCHHVAGQNNKWFWRTLIRGLLFPSNSFYLLSVPLTNMIFSSNSTTQWPQAMCLSFSLVVSSDKTVLALFSFVELLPILHTMTQILPLPEASLILLGKLFLFFWGGANCFLPLCPQVVCGYLSLIKALVTFHHINNYLSTYVFATPQWYFLADKEYLRLFFIHPMAYHPRN